MHKCITVVGSLLVALSSASARGQQPASDGSILPFPPVTSPSIAGPTLQQSTYKPFPPAVSHLKPGAPNVLIILMDDVGFGTPDTFGGPVHTPTFTRIYNEGIVYNRFHTTSICSPTRAALLTGRNHHRAHSGTIAERAVDFDGYTGVIPASTAGLPKVLGDYGYETAAFGKWHNTPAVNTTVMGPFDLWPNGFGFGYFYGFLAGETSQYEPRLYENRNPIEPPHDPKYHLSTDMADQAVTWLDRHEAFAPDKPFFLYWAPGAGHGPHQIFREWADKYKGKFDDGWDALQQRTYEKQKELGIIPPDAKLTPRPDTLASWASIPESERPFQARLMEVFAGFVEHADAQAGRVIDEIDHLGIRDNTIIFFVWGDNGSSAEGQNGSISELLAQNQIPNTIQQQIEAINKMGGLDVLGGPKTDNIYHAGWAWAGDSPLRYTKLVASHFGGTRNPLVISWPGHIKPDKTPRPQFHHVTDIVPTIYELAGITPPKVVDGIKQAPLDGVSMVYTFDNVTTPTRKRTQYFENNGSRGIYHDGWYACTFGPLVPWKAGGTPGLKDWDANKDVWELYDMSNDFSQANDLAAKNPQKLAELKKIFLQQAKENEVFPVGGALLTRIDPRTRISSPYRSWRFDSHSTRMPEFAAPGLGRESNHVTIDAELGNEASGVLYALGGAGGGLTVYMDKGQLVYEYNMMIIERYIVRAPKKLAAGKHKIEVDTTIARPAGPAEVVLSVDGEEVARETVKRTVPAAFTASETFDVGADLGSPVSLDYFERAPFKFDGTIQDVLVALK